MSHRTSRPRTGSIKGSASEPRWPLDRTAGVEKNADVLNLDYASRDGTPSLRARVSSLTAHNTHLEDPVYLDLVCDLILVHRENLLHSHYSNYEQQRNVVSRDAGK